MSIEPILVSVDALLGTLRVVGTGGGKVHRAGAMRGRGGRLAGVVAVAAVATCGLVACSTDAADQKVIDRLSKLDVMVVPAGATKVSRTSTKGGGNSVIRNASSVTLVYATPRTPFEVKKDIHSRFDASWHFLDNAAAPLGGWAAIGGKVSEPGTTATVEARPVTPADKAPKDTQSVVTVTTADTRPA